MAPSLARLSGTMGVVSGECAVFGISPTRKFAYGVHVPRFLNSAKEM